MKEQQHCNQMSEEQVILTKKTKKPRTSSLATSYIVPEGSTATHSYEVGVDEAGRGPLFGRVYTGAVILPPADSPSGAVFDFSLLKDSKKFSSDKRIREVAD